MVVTAGDLTAADIKLPILVGGAALTRNFVDKKIAPAYAGGFVEYAKDAMNGLELAKRIVDENEFQNLKESVVQRRLSLMKAEGTFMSSPAISREENRSEVVPWQEIPPVPPDLDRHVVTLPLESVWKWINPLMLYGRHLGLKGNHIRALTDPQKANEFRNDANFEKAKALWEKVETLKRSVGNQIEAKAVYQFFKMVSIGNKLQVGDEVEWTFQRQRQGEKLCLSDYVNPKEAPQDFGALFVAAAVGPMRELADEMKERGDYFSSHALLALALETAEASAEYLHSLLRTQWGFPDAPDMNMMERFQARYRGKRYSFGYPACPELEFQKDLFKLLRPEEIGVQLTEGFMMQPESAVSAIVFSHPSAKYFGVL